MTTYPDPYSECELALKTVLLEMTDFFTHDWQVSNNDTNIARGADYFVVLRPGSFPLFQQSNTGMEKDIDWNTVLDLYVKYTEYEESWDRFKYIRAAILWKLGTNPILACTDSSKSAKNVWGVTLTSDENPQYFSFAEVTDNARPNFIIQTMQVTTRQRVVFPF